MPLTSDQLTTLAAFLARTNPFAPTDDAAGAELLVGFGVPADSAEERFRTLREAYGAGILSTASDATPEDQTPPIDSDAAELWNIAVSRTEAELRGRKWVLRLAIPVAVVLLATAVILKMRPWAG